MNTSDSIKELSAALAKAQSAVKVAQKNKRNPHLKNDYADLSSIWAACRSALTSNGLSVVQDVQANEGNCIAVKTRIMHVSGEWIEVGPLVVPATKFDAQGIGSAISYGKRYALSAAVGVVSGDEDDDAEATGVDHTPDLSPAEAAILNQLREAALNGAEALQATFAGLPKSREKASVWQRHSDELKAAANAV